MGLQGLLCGCFATPRTNGDVQAQVPQEPPAELVTSGNNSKRELLPLEEAESEPPCAGCVAKDSVNSISSNRQGRSRVDAGVDYRYGLPSGKHLSSRALVGGVEYDSFFVNPLAEGSHDGGMAIDYAGAALGVGLGHNNPLAAEYSGDASSNASSVPSSAPGSPAQVKIRTLAAGRYAKKKNLDGAGGSGGGACCGGGRGDDDSICPTAPGTPLQGRKTVKVIGVAIACESACSEHSGSVKLLADAAPCYGLEDEAQAAKTAEEEREVLAAAAAQPPLPPRRVTAAESRFASEAGRRSIEEAGSGPGFGGEAGAGEEEAAGGQKVEEEEVAAAAEEMQQCRSEDARRAACASRSDSWCSLALETTPSASPRRAAAAGSSGGAVAAADAVEADGCGGGKTDGAQCLRDALRVPSTPELSPPLGLPPQIPVCEAEPIARRVDSETEAAVPEQHESDIEEGDSGAAAAAGAFAPCTPPLAARDAGISGATPPQSGGREPRAPHQVGDRSVKSDGGTCGNDDGGALLGEVPELRSATSAPPPPPRLALEASPSTAVGRCLAEPLLQLRSVPMVVAATAAPLPPQQPARWADEVVQVSLAGMAPESLAAAPAAACESINGSKEALEVEAAVLFAPEAGDQSSEPAQPSLEAQEEAQALPDAEPALLAAADEVEAAAAEEAVVLSQSVSETSPPALAAAVAPIAEDAPQELSACALIPCAEAAAAADAAEAAPASAAPPASVDLTLVEPSTSLESDRPSPDLRKAKGFNSCGGGGGRNSPCSSLEVTSVPLPQPPSQPQPPACPVPPPGSAPRRRGLPADSITGLSMTRLLIRQLGLIPPPRLSPLATPRDAAGDVVAEAPPPAAAEARGYDDLPAASPFAVAISAATAALNPADAPTIQAAIEVPRLPEVRRTCESVSVTFALALPCDVPAAAPPPAVATTVKPRTSDVASCEVLEPWSQPASAAAAVSGAVAAAVLEDDDDDEEEEAKKHEEEEDYSTSLISTRESSALFEERSSYGLYGVASSRSVQGWLEPQGWKPLRERYGTAGGGGGTAGGGGQQ